MAQTIQIFRTQVSPYQKKDFQKKEKKTIEGIKHKGHKLEYTLSPPTKNSIIITNTLTKIEKIMDIDWNLVKLIVHPNSGYDNFPFEFVEKAKFPIIIGNPIRAHAVCNYILSCLFEHYNPIPKHKSWHKGRHWKRKFILTNKRVLLIGYGHIGKILHQVLLPLVREVAIYDPFKGKDELNVDGIDIVIPCANLNPTCHYMINTKFLEKLSKNVLIINASRGAIIDPVDLTCFLQTHPTAFAYLDVYEKEPADFSGFRKLDNVITTSHIAGVYHGLDMAILNFEKTIITDFLSMPDKRAFKRKHAAILMKNRIHNGFLI